jgi:sulfur carrier protein
MTIKVNNEKISVENNATIETIVRQMNLPSFGVAIARNNKMVPRTEWSTTLLQEDDSIVVVKAACGG